MSTLSYDASGAAQQAIAKHIDGLVEDRIATRIFAKDHTLWGPDAESEAAIRLGWVEAATVSQSLVGDILELRDALRAEGVSRIVLCGMGGSSLAPEVIAGTAGVELTVLDSTDPEQVSAALADRLAETAIVVSSKSGSTVETDSQRRVFEKAFNDAGIDAKSRIIIVTDPGSPLDKASREAGYRAVFNADPNVGGRFSALTAFGLVPCGLAGVDIQAFLDEAEEAAEILNEDSTDNIGLALGIALGGTSPLRNKIVIAEDGSGIVGFADWAEQLIAESTGKLGTGVLPVVAGPDSPEALGGAEDVLVVRLVSADADIELRENEVAIAGGLASQMFVWEFATSVAGRLLGINPFDQPDVEAAKVAARGLLDARPEPTPAAFTDGAVEVRGGEWLGSADSVTDAVQALLGQLGSDGYLSVQAYLDRITHAPLEGIRDELAAVSGRPVTFGWGPRFLHSTGQFHKGGPAIGVFLQITAASSTDLEIPERPFTFGQLIAAQASGDAQVLEGHGRPVLRLHLTERAAGVAQLQEVVAALAGQASSLES
ncbi:MULTISPECIES: glucose-6-phosphate isomerase [Paenarthrobacter]|jgi:glucose-6-phosphate isomerase|uniref:glucose-6-phosphate isomerase n=1 Tax=Paenarthrobacter TaxID=1742992 RepID=UPI00057D2B79|nr:MULTISPECIES: glucose-6-phosphate isomerase [Paenarthrobacter]KIA73202.1 glucose-6-phosphate isomerase [Arthrobacter sp. MWB30]BCW10739.1 glucose-6-phosphate isomerase [Arthrobacter sp. NtRootA2]BCW14823.1 glucose-6-phosphate isomerase [Arthrobacter sp. NtRootA4]BCW23158.1 glucose-6-phosphate isomerase [Arthrobacter sp. NtRootC7]BCW27425.1 glucose-6-phosphate isomerase [Arthrobacter sp. NtRootC45]BCW31692.1 glucose-6-phosphate isomerase [Arthrobacter sp. NtRootD5]